MSVLDYPNVARISDSNFEVTIYDVTGTPTGKWIVSAWTSWTKWDVMWLPRGASQFAGYPGNPVYDWEDESFRSPEDAVVWCLDHPR